MYKKGDWIIHLKREQRMRIQRDQLDGDKTQGRVWCEWADEAYHVEVHDASDLTALDPSQWPTDL